jgi:dTDP-4-dehydrorhamnose reductase
MRILLTGTDGQVGGALLPLLSIYGTVIAPLIAEFDLSKPEALADRLDGFSPDLIVNAAAYTAVDRAEDERALAFLINARGPEAIAQWAAKHRVPLVHFSTDYVFDGSGETPWREDSLTGPLSVYGASKLAGDTAIRAAGGAHLIARTSWVYAAKGANFLRTIARLAGERKELRIVADQIGAPTAASAIASAITDILLPNLSNLNELFARNGGVVNLVCSGETSWHGFASAIVAGLKSRGVELAVETIIPIATTDFPTKARRPGNSRLDLSRLKNQFGVTTPTWQEALIPELDNFVALQNLARAAE